MKLHHRLHALIYPCEDLPGQWGAHCLELDLVSQGNSADHAAEMIAEAIELVAQSNVSHGHPPLTFRSAPPEDWARLKGADEVATRILRLPAGGFADEDEVTLAPVLMRAG